MEQENQSDYYSTTDDEGVHTEKNPLLPSKVKIHRFSLAQRAHLNSFYQTGMNSTSRSHAALVEQAAKDTGLTTEQVKVRLFTSIGPL